mgnify:CR=1 FL=1
MSMHEFCPFLTLSELKVKNTHVYGTIILALLSAKILELAGTITVQITRQYFPYYIKLLLYFFFKEIFLD